MGDKAKGKSSSKLKKTPKAAKAGRRPHELRQIEHGLKKPA
jgi:hypothetical protein